MIKKQQSSVRVLTRIVFDVSNFIDPRTFDTYIYIYIERERDREKDNDTERDIDDDA